MTLGAALDVRFNLPKRSVPGQHLAELSAQQNKQSDKIGIACLRMKAQLLRREHTVDAPVLRETTSRQTL
jgi:hypothetical protein